MKSLADLRKDYTKAGLMRADLDTDPVKQFDRWFAVAESAGVNEPNAMTLATVDADGRADARVVLLKEFSKKGFVFFTNYESAKGKQLALNPGVALIFDWNALERQVRIRGKAEKISREETLEYFSSRPRASQLGAWASHQSEVVANREVLEQQWKEVEARFKGEDVPLPDFWGGYLVRVEVIEFWQGRTSRMHDRFRYTRSETEDIWMIERLSP